MKNWLGGNGYAVASRSNITKGKYGQDYINMDQPDLTHITTALLNRFDIIIGDLSVFKTFGRSEELALQQEISQKGLGVIIRADSSNKTKSWLQSSFPVSYLAAKQQTPTVLILQNNEKTARLNIDPLFIIPQNNTQPLITDDHNHLLAAMALGGEGKLVFTTINNSYTWALSGNQKDYAALWSLLIDKAARKLPVAGQWSVAPSVPTVNQPVQLLAESAVPLTGATIDQTIIYPAQNPDIPFRQQYTYWPKKYGWQQVVQPHSTNYWWFAWRKNGWLSLNIAKKESVNKQFFNSGYSPDVVTKQIQQKINEIVPKIYFYILFLMSLTFLWTESKFYSS